jgi:hypothetical protein
VIAGLGYRDETLQMVFVPGVSQPRYPDSACARSITSDQSRKTPPGVREQPSFRVGNAGRDRMRESMRVLAHTTEPLDKGDASPYRGAQTGLIPCKTVRLAERDDGVIRLRLSFGASAHAAGTQNGNTVAARKETAP